MKCKNQLSANIVLHDDFSVPSGGIDYEGETLGEFFESIGVDFTILSTKEINSVLRECGIKAVNA